MRLESRGRLSHDNRRAADPRLAARSEIVESGHFLLMSSVDEQATAHYLWID
jgi:hypothetical protein